MTNYPFDGDRGAAPVSLHESGNRQQEKREKGLSRDAVKLIAVFLMTLNHIGNTFDLPFIFKEIIE